MNEKLGWDKVNHLEDENIKKVSEKVTEIYTQDNEIGHNQIESINKELSQIPNLVINFDETMTKESTIDDIIDILCLELKNQAKAMRQKYEIWQNNIKNKTGNPVKDFYENVIVGVDKEILEKVV